MCIGVPMRVTDLLGDGMAALCRSRGGATETIDLSLTGPVPVGTWLLTFIGAARSVLTAQEAAQVADALEALDIALAGGSVDHLFADLIDREPQLPAHLRPATSD
jgi:hydrogenase assembly chaperone HypC/HupF